ncbi:MAG: hypothetical protein JSV27_10595 [Candidatus Bathyarchaeota archaeon]|nr:MAG: hypothetical protein JSV27_10595 [Candidatus Bathyarchaeota archaeon]
MFELQPDMFSDVELWRRTTYALVVVSSIFFLLQRTSWAMFDPIFELCIFHIPTIFSALFYLKTRIDSEDRAQNGK